VAKSWSRRAFGVIPARRGQTIDAIPSWTADRTECELHGVLYWEGYRHEEDDLRGPARRPPRARDSRRAGAGGMPPLGYDVKNRKLVVNDAEARIVVEIYRRYLALKSVPREYPW
jgi:hypothetical protein